jgi:hypothetical protein
MGSTHVSLCAGSIVSVLFALLANVAQGEIVAIPMTPALGGSICLLETPASMSREAQKKSPCHAGKRCMESVATSIHKADALIPQSTPLAHVAQSDIFTLQRASTKTPLAFRWHRPPGRSRTLALSVVLRE